MISIRAIGSCCGRGMLQAGYACSKLREAGVECVCESRRDGEKLMLAVEIDGKPWKTCDVGEWMELVDAILEAKK